MELKRVVIISTVPSCLECTMLEAQMGDCLDGGHGLPQS